MKLNLIDIYKILANLVERENDKIETFAALKFTEQFNFVALDKNYKYSQDPNAGIFYSKDWVEGGFSKSKLPINFPAIISFQNSMRVATNFNPIYTVEIYAVNVDESTTKGWEVLMAELDEILVLILRELREYVYLDNGQSSGWFHSDDVDGVTGRQDGWLRERIKTRQISISRGYEQTPKNLLTVGTAIEIEGCF